MTDDNVM